MYLCVLLSIFEIYKTLEFNVDTKYSNTDITLKASNISFLYQILLNYVSNFALEEKRGKKKVAPPTGVPNGGHGLVGSADLPGLLQESKGSPIEAWTSEKSVPGAGAAAVNKRAGRVRGLQSGNCGGRKMFFFRRDFSETMSLRKINV